LMNAPEQLIKSDGFRPLDALRMFSVPFRIGMFTRFYREVDKRIGDPRLRQVLYQYATYSGASPYLAPGTLAVISYCEMHFGGWYPRGGMYTIAKALEQLAVDVGVEIQTSCVVERIVVDRDMGTRGKSNPRVSGVEVSGRVIEADAVVCNADVVWAYKNLLPETDRPHYTDRKLKSIEPGGSGMCLMLGVDQTYPQLAHHTKFMPRDYTSDLKAMFETRTIPSDPCIYVCASTRTDPMQAPAGCENLFVLCSAPPIDGTIDWAVQGPVYEAQIVQTLETRWGLKDLGKRIVVSRRITPDDLASLYNANAGTIYGISSNGIKAAFMRPPNRDKTIGGLYFAGGATHPGGGLPLVALSGKIASDLCCEDLGLKRTAEQPVRVQQFSFTSDGRSK